MKISIITVTFNSIKNIEQCINSVRNQSYNNIEHIIIDGASKDNTVAFLKSKLNKFTKILSEEDKGIYDAMNKGIKLASGDLIAFLNSDDFYAHDNVVTKIANVFKNEPTIDACYSDLIYIDKVNILKTIRYLKSCEFKQGLFMKGWCPPHPTFVVRRSVFERYGEFDLNYPLASDFDLMIRFLEIHRIKSTYIPEVLVHMRIGGATNKNLKNILQQNLEILNIFKKNNLPLNVYKFFFNKIISRFNQFFVNSNFK